MSTVINTGSTPAPYLGRAMFEWQPDFNYVGGVVAPVIMAPVDKKNGTLPNITASKTSGENLDNVRAPGSAYNRDQVEINTDSYEVVGHGKEIPLPEEDIAWYSSVMDAEIVAAGKIKNDLLVEREIKVKDMIFNTTTFTGASLFTDVSSAPWDTAGSDAKGHIVAAKEKVRVNSGMMPNALIVGHATYNNLIFTNTYFSTTVLSGLAVPSPEQVKAAIEAILGLKIIDADAIYNSAIEGQSYSGAYIWPDDYAMIARIATSSNPAEPALARLIGWSPEPSAAAMEFATYGEPQTKSMVIQGDMYYDEIIRGTQFGHLLKVDA